MSTLKIATLFLIPVAIIVGGLSIDRLLGLTRARPNFVRFLLVFSGLLYAILAADRWLAQGYGLGFWASAGCAIGCMLWAFFPKKITTEN